MTGWLPHKFSKQVVWVQDIIKLKNSSLVYRGYIWFIQLTCSIASKFKLWSQNFHMWRLRGNGKSIVLRVSIYIKHVICSVWIMIFIDWSWWFICLDNSKIVEEFTKSFKYNCKALYCNKPFKYNWVVSIELWWELN